jgi:tetratricopeptide (TPR) repeat protein
MGLGGLYSASGDWESAAGLYERARALFEQCKDLEANAQVRNMLGVLFLQTGRPRKALDHFAASIAIKQGLKDAVGECRTLTELSRCYFVCGDKAQAAEYADRASARSRDIGLLDAQARARIVLGLLAADDGDIQAAKREMMAASLQCQRLDMLPELVTIYHELGQLASQEKQYGEAVTYHEQAFRALRAIEPNTIVATLHLADLVGLRAKALRASPPLFS